MTTRAMSLRILSRTISFVALLATVFAVTSFPPAASSNTGLASGSTGQHEVLQIAGDGRGRTPGHQNPQIATNMSPPSANYNMLRSLTPRDALPCGEGNPCVDGSCCSLENKCGYGPDYCGDTKCRYNCTATAMCGKYSEGGSLGCGMKLCCSAMGWCGTTNDYCGNADPKGGLLPCQAGFGSCQMYPPPSCGADSGTTNGRTIGYYQSWNVRKRACNTVTPSQIDTTGYTHLYYSFASIDPHTFAVVPAHPDDPYMYSEFTRLSQGRNLQTWIAIGGFDFSDPDQPTHTTWSDLCSTPANRAVFINSLQDFMVEYGFQGVDLDWEYPGTEDRGGKREDTQNLVALVKEMRAAWGLRFGISMTLAPDYWYLRYFDAIAMQDSVDFFGFMAYDLHGSWDADVKALGKLVRAQTDIRDISNDTVPLWFDGLNPAKINFGLALYGRGYTLRDNSCTSLLCPFSGPSLPAPCTNFAGVMSLVEINQLIKKKGITPQYVPEAIIKQITWDDQWIGYDDAETIAKKKTWANERCFGGTMLWSVDFQVKGSGGPPDDLDVVYLGTEVYASHTAHCTPPCVFVLPPSSLPSPSTISVAPYTTSLQVGTGGAATITTITVNVQPLTVTAIQFSNINVSATQTKQSVFQPSTSLDIPPAVVTVTGPNGILTSRTVLLPPWPAEKSGPPDHWRPHRGPWRESTLSSFPADTTGIVVTALPDPPLTTPPTSIPMTTTPATTTPATTTPTTTTTLVPVGEIDIIETTVVQSEGGDDGGRTNCDLKFLNFCIIFGRLRIGGLLWKFPPGRYKGIVLIRKLKLPEDFSIEGLEDIELPEIDIGPDRLPTQVQENPTSCETQSASFCSISTSFGLAVSGQVTKTTATKTTKTCDTIPGCAVEDTTTATSAAACNAQSSSAGATGMPIVARANPIACETDGNYDGIIYPADGNAVNPQNIRDILVQRDGWLQLMNIRRGWREIRSASLGYTVYFYVNNMGPQFEHWIEQALPGQIKYKYHFTTYQLNAGVGTTNRQPATIITHDPENSKKIISRNNTSKFLKRASVPNNSLYWSPAGVSVPPTVDFLNDARIHPVVGMSTRWADTSGGAGQVIYMLESSINRNTPELAHVNFNYVPLDYSYGAPLPLVTSHGTMMTACAAGINLGLAPNAAVVMVQTYDAFDVNIPIERFLESLVRTADHIVANRNVGKSVVNMSFSLPQAFAPWPCWDAMEELLRRMVNYLQVVPVTAAGNYGTQIQAVDSYPALLGAGMSSLIVVGATDYRGQRWPDSQTAPFVEVYAPGVQVWNELVGLEQSGTSISSATVAGLVAYFRGLTNKFNLDMTQPQNVVSTVENYLRPVNAGGPDRNQLVIWNGNVFDKSCLVDTGGFLLDVCPPEDSDDDDDDDEGGNSGGTCPRGFVSSRNSCTRAPSITYSPGSPSPTCAANCGKLCTGFYCAANPSGTPPDFFDPAEPSSGAQNPTANPGGNPTGSSGGNPTENPTINPTAAPVPTGLPPLDGQTMPSGMVCTLTSTFKQCAGGPGGQVACVTTSSCAGFGKTASSAPPTTTPSAPKPTDNGSLCFGSVTEPDVDGQTTVVFAVWKPGDYCSRTNAQILGQWPIDNECSLVSKGVQFTVCGTPAALTSVGPALNVGTSLSQDCTKTPFGLVINGVSYAASKIDQNNDPCRQTCNVLTTVASARGEFMLDAVPICVP